MEKEFWEQRWDEGKTGWDIGYPAPAIMDYFSSLSDKKIKVLIPGCGNAYEAQGIFDLGFKNVWTIDITEQATTSFAQRCPDFPKEQIIHGDFFKNQQINDLEFFDVIVEQTFLCAIHPSQREDYCKRMSELMNDQSKLVGLMFDFPLDSGPPFGGTYEEYHERFTRYFEEVSIQRCENSIAPRAGREFWIEVSKPKVG